MLSKQTPLVINTLAAVGSRLGEQLGVKTPVLTMANNPVQQYLNRADGRNDQPVTDYPMFWIKPRSFQLNHQSPYSPSRMAKSPLTVIAGRTSEGTYQQVRLIPALYQVECTFLTNDTQEALSFATGWTAMSRSGKADLMIEYLGIMMSIYVEMSDSVDLPEFDMGEDINHVQVTATLTVHAYVELPGAPTQMIPPVDPVKSAVIMEPAPTNDSDNPNRYVTYAAAGEYARPVQDPDNPQGINATLIQLIGNR